MKTIDKEYQKKVEKLKDLIGIQLDQCESYKTPVTCANASDPVARINLIDVLFEICLSGNISVSEAIDRYERTFNPNMAN